MAIIQKIKNTFKSIVKGFLAISISIGIIAYFRWVGLKGIISYVLGLTTAIILILSKNQILISILDLMGSGYAKELEGGKHEKDQ